MRLPFTKMHGLGNDFMVLDLISHPVSLSADQIRQLADRQFGVGFDQMLLIEAPTQPDVDFNYRIYNCDGSESRENITGRCLVSAVTAYAGLKSGSTGATCTVASGSLRICTGSTTSSETSCGATWYEVNSNYYYADSACATLIGPGVSTETQRCR